MHEKKKQISAKVLPLGCLLTCVLVLASLFLGVAVVSTSGIGVVGKASDSNKSPVGSWELPNGTVQRYLADGTGTATIRDGSVSHFEWRMKGDQLALDWFSNPSSVGSRLFRLQRGLGLMGERGSTNYILVDVTSDKLILGIDDEPAGTRQKRGDQFECTAADTDRAEVRPAADEGSE